MAWKAIVHSATGTSHKQQQTPCQDYGNYVVVGEVIVGAVSDGAGSAKYSHIGAKLAVEAALRYLEAWLKHHQEKKSDLQQPISEEGANTVFTNTLRKVIITLNEEASKGCTLNSLACTLLVFMATPEWIAAMQVGDGFIVVNSQNSEYQLLFQPDKGEYANETTFVTSAHALYQMRVRVIPGHHKFICTSTDGLERLAINMRGWTPSPGFFQPFQEGLKTRNINQEYESLLNWLDSEEVNARTDDDKTLLLCLYDTDANLDNCIYPERSLSKPINSQGQNKLLDSQPKAMPWYLLTQTFICHILAGCLLQANYALVAWYKGFEASVAIFFMVAIALSISLYITLAKIGYFFGKWRGIVILSVTALIGLSLGRLLYLIMGH